MKDNALSVSAAPPETRRAAAGLFPFLLCTALWGAFLWLIGRLTLLPYAAAGALFSFFPLFCASRGKRRVVGAALFLILALSALIFSRPIFGGLARLANRLFTVSAARQRYLYDLFPESSSAPAPGVLWASALLAVCFGWLGARYHAAPGVFSILMTAAACAYFGVTPGAFWLLLILAVSGCSMLSKLDWRTCAMLLVSAAMIAGLALWLVPGESRRVSELDDRLRDTLAVTTVTQSRQPDSAPTPTPDVQPERADTEPMLLQIRESMDLKTVILIVLIVVILLLLFVPAVIRDRLQKRRERNRAGMDSADHAEAIRAAFRYALLWLRAAGQPAQETPGYDAAYRLWQEAAFSDHAMTAAQREQMTAFQQRVSEAVLSRAGRRLRWKLRYRYAL